MDTLSNTSQGHVAATPQASFHDAYAAMAEEHARIMGLVDLFKAAPDPSLLVPQLEELHTLLVNHFAHEQFPGGLYEAMGAFGSRWHEELRELIRDHCLILSETRGVLEHARKSTPATRHALHAEVMALVAQLDEHERKEHHLAERLGTTR